jgi:peptidoglycan hydrolase-like protein with peptidoglycan-binding domain
VPATAAGATPGLNPDDAAKVKVYFTPVGSECDVLSPRARTVEKPAVATNALRSLLAGPTPWERRHGITSLLFSDETAGMLRSVAIRDGVAHVDLADLRPLLPTATTACGRTSLLGQLDTTLLQFPTVHATRYAINGSQDAFYRWLGMDVPGRSTVAATRGSLDNTRTLHRWRGAGATLTRVRVGRHRGFDRLVLQFDGGRPAYHIGYRGVPVSGGSGQPIAVLGTTALQVDLGAATIDMTSSEFPTTFRPTHALTPRYPALRQVRYGGQFEGQSTFAVGLRGRSGFRVLELRNPTRLAIDVAHDVRVRRLRRGRRGGDVRDWQQQLNAVQTGAFATTTRRARPLAIDGVFGRSTHIATKTFQRAAGLRVTGVVDGRTRTAMRHALAAAAGIRP